MAVSDHSHLTEFAKQAAAFFREAVQETKMYLALGKDAVLGALKGLAGITHDTAQTATQPQSQSLAAAHNRGSPGTGRG